MGNLGSIYEDIPDFSELPDEAGGDAEGEKKEAAPDEIRNVPEADDSGDVGEATGDDGPSTTGDEEAAESEEDGEEAEEGEGDGEEAETQKEAAAAQATVPEEVDVDGEKVKVADLVSAWKAAPDLRAETDKLKKVESDFGAMRADLIERPAKALMAIFRSHDGDREKAYARMRDFAFAVAEWDYNFNQLSDREKRAVFIEAENEELKEKARVEDEAKKSEAEKKREEGVRKILSDALAKAGEGDSDFNIRLLSSILSESRSKGKPLTLAEAIVELKKTLQKEWERGLNRLDPKNPPDDLQRKLAQGRVQKATQEPQKSEAKTPPPKKGHKRRTSKGQPRNIVIGMSQFGQLLDGELDDE